MNSQKARRIAIRILEEFEDLLDAKGIQIPSSDREGREEACLYGTEYYLLEDAITEILVEETRTRRGGSRSTFGAEDAVGRSPADQ